MTKGLSISDFERFNAVRLLPTQKRPSLLELLVTAGITLSIVPFGFVTFSVIPMMGQITVGFALLLTGLYLFFRRSVLVAATTMSCAVVFWSVLFLSIQSIKNNLEIPLLIFTVLGIPVIAMYCMFVGTRIWTIRGGVE